MNELQAKIAAASTAMLLITAARLDEMECTETAERMTRALVNDELAIRFPETAEALDAWSEDLDSELTMFQVILSTMNEMPVAA